MASVVIMLRYAHHYGPGSNIVKTALGLVSRLKYEQEQRPPWNSFLKTLQKDTEDVRAWWYKIHSPEYKKRHPWRVYDGLTGEKRVPMPLTDEMGDMCNLHWTAIEELVIDFLNCPYEYETIGDLLFMGDWGGSSKRIVADLWAISNFIFPASLMNLREEVEEAIDKTRNTYFKVVRSALTTELKPYILFKEQFGPYKERWAASSQEKVDQIRTYGLRWSWDERADTDFDCFKWALNHALRSRHGFDLTDGVVVKKEDTWWGTRYFSVARKDGKILRARSVSIFGTYEIYAGPGVNGRIEKIEHRKRR
jgi:hypothetical protein